MNNHAAPFPPPPDIAPIGDLPNADPIKFERRAGGVIARIGYKEIGEIQPLDPRQVHPLRRASVRAYWKSFLPGGHGARPAASVAEGCEELAEHVRAWFLECGAPLPKAGAK